MMSISYLDGYAQVSQKKGYELNKMWKRNNRRNLTSWLFIGEGVAGYGRWLNPIDCQPPKIMLPNFLHF